MKQERNNPIRLMTLRAVCLTMIVALLNITISCNYFKVRTLEDLTADLSKERAICYSVRFNFAY
ncbi:MAG: hypothetical protein ABI723_16580 [Bacteroidia bacterium]